MLSTIALDTQVIRPGLCTGCGECITGCPTAAIVSHINTDNA